MHPQAPEARGMQDPHGSPSWPPPSRPYGFLTILEALLTYCSWEGCAPKASALGATQDRFTDWLNLTLVYTRWNVFICHQDVHSQPGTL